ncbi:MAG: hypothetical protein ACREJ5_11675 [Geminicoccaceae bacterium]
MLAIGGLLTCVALLTLAAVAPVFRSSNPPRWTTYGWVGEAVALAIVGTLALGVGAGAIDAFQTGLDYADLGLLAGVVLVAVVIWRSLEARAQSRALEAGAAVRARVPASGDAGGGRAAPAERVPMTVGEPPPPHRAA